MSEFEIDLDRAKCIGSGLCLIASADHFEQDENGYVVLLPPATDGDPHADPDARDAVENCPSGALSWRRRKAGLTAAD
ncbi:ferredoxin [Amycolatopsis sp. QT-25]|uniref:ferredoxin n=1 Tax=Amycolatopsis sp. QT-25 TaxID=3034022 RepID=UPI0023EB2420|nr:ferredoxin [Amycolatopsis sp. QT-25]WET80802.1 ferredoxin [Amycolatopsis sp. QT-25]